MSVPCAFPGVPIIRFRINRTAMRFPLLSILLLTGCGGTAGPSSGPNIVLIVSDDHHWKDHGFMGHPVVRTPHLDRLATESLVYTRGYTPTSVCRPSLATIVSGLYPHQHGITGNDPPGGAIRDPEARAAMEGVFHRTATILEQLHQSGYVSHQSGKWWEGNPTDHGFTAGMTHGEVMRGGRHGDTGLTIGREGLQPITDFLSEAGRNPFLLYYAPFLPHTPHNPPDSLLQGYLGADRPLPEAKYYAMIEWFDLTVGTLLDHLEEAGHYDNTLVMYVVDNGWLPAGEGQGRFDSRAKMSPYDAGMRTPIMLRWPGVVRPGMDHESLASTIDIVPTLLAAAGSAASPDLPGLNLLDRDQLAGREMIFGALFAHTSVDLHDPAANLKYRYGVRKDGWKLILPFPPNRDVELMINGDRPYWMRLDHELYNVRTDPYEVDEQSLNHPELAAELAAELDAWWSVSP